MSSTRVLPFLIAMNMAAALMGSAHAQSTTERPAYKGFRADEDWSSLRDPSKRTDSFDPIKWIPLNADGSW